MSNDFEPNFDDSFLPEDDFSSPSEMSGDQNFDESNFSPEDHSEQEELAPNMPKFRRPRLDIYTFLLILSLSFIIIATVLHYFECPLQEYGDPPYVPGSSFPPPPSAT
ncbi:MAG: hypothetical protein Q4C96_10060 [Planctomycetia bacterium]|nr:hypothetical protein [Planctomycetia bacterium]